MIITIAVKTREYYDAKRDDFFYDETYVDIDVDTDLLAELVAEDFGVTETQAKNFILEFDLQEQILEKYADELEEIAYMKYVEEWC